MDDLVRKVLDDLKAFSSARRDKPELHIYPLAFYDIVRVPDYQNFYRPPEMGKDKRLVGYLFGMPMVLDPGLPAGTWLIRPSVCQYCESPLDWERSTCPKCGGSYE